MKIVFCALLLLNFAFCDINISTPPMTEQNATKDKIETLINDILAINSQISQENNSTKKAQLTADKLALLNQIPTALTQKQLTSYTQYLDKRALLQKALRNSPQSAKDKIALEELNLNENFYFALFELKRLFIKGASSKEISLTLNNSLKSLNQSNISDIKSADKTTKQTTVLAFENRLKTYVEIIEFLLQKTDYLGDSFIFTTLNLSSCIAYINGIFPFEFGGFDFGKFLIIIATILIFYCFRRFLAWVTYKILSVFHKDDIKDLKNEVISMLIRPLGIVLIAYSVDICVDIFFYPSPTPAICTDISQILYILLYAWLVMRILDCYSLIFLNKISIKKRHKDMLNLINKFLYVVVIVAAILLTLSRLGFNTSAIIASFGIGGFAVAFASKDIIANFFSSVIMLFDDSFYQGDSVSINGVDGVIVETGLRKTSIRTADNSLIFIPNSKIIDGVIKNNSRRKMGLLITLFVRLEYQTSSQKITNIIENIKSILIAHKDIAATAESFTHSKTLKFRQNMVSLDDLVGYKSGASVCLNDFSENGIVIKINCYTKTIAQPLYDALKQDVMLRILQIIEANGAKFISPKNI